MKSTSPSSVNRFDAMIHDSELLLCTVGARLHGVGEKFRLYCGLYSKHDTNLIYDASIGYTSSWGLPNFNASVLNHDCRSFIRSMPYVWPMLGNKIPKDQHASQLLGHSCKHWANFCSTNIRPRWPQPSVINGSQKWLAYRARINYNHPFLLASLIPHAREMVFN